MLKKPQATPRLPKMAVQKSRSPTFFPVFVAAIFQSIIAIGTICICICNGAALSPQGTCQISNFQLPETEPESHVVLQPLQSMALTALTISFTAKMKKATEYPVIVSYAVRREHDEFSLELPGTATEEAGYYIWIGGNYFGQEHAPFPIDVWTNVTATWNGTNGEYAMYINGEPVIPLTQNDDFKHTLRSGGKLVLGQKQKRGGVESSSRFIGSVINLRMWPIVFNAYQLQSLQQGNLSNINISPILDIPPTYTSELVEGARCDAECQPGKLVLENDGTEIKCGNCPPGKISTELGSTSCTACPPGKYSASAGSQLCKSCSTGEFQKKSGQTSCQKCPPGEYSLIPESKLCLKCPDDLPSIEDASYVQCLNGILLKTNAKIASLEAMEKKIIEQGGNRDLKINKLETLKISKQDVEVMKKKFERDGVNRDVKINQLKAMDIKIKNDGANRDVKISNLRGRMTSVEGRRCETGEVRYPVNDMGDWKYVTVNFKTAFQTTPSVLMAPRKAWAYDIYRGLGFIMLPASITTTGFQARFLIRGRGFSDPDLKAAWIACS